MAVPGERRTESAWLGRDVFCCQQMQQLRMMGWKKSNPLHVYVRVLRVGNKVGVPACICFTGVEHTLVERSN